VDANLLLDTVRHRFPTSPARGALQNLYGDGQQASTRTRNYVAGFRARVTVLR